MTPSSPTVPVSALSPTSLRSPRSPTSPRTPGKPRVKKKVRMQEVVMDEDLHKPVDTFHVTISDLRGVLRVVEPRPVLLSFEFDNYWYAETDVYSRDIKPQWGFNAASIRGHDGRKPVSPPGDEESPRAYGVKPTTRFLYETELGYKLHKKFLVVKLSERSPHGDVEWGSAVLPLDSIARGCQATELTIMGKDGVTCYGTVMFNMAMVNVQKVRAHITDLKLSGYPEVYRYDVKLVYLEFGLKGFEGGYKKCTEKRSDEQPRFSAQPALEWNTKLADMLTSSASKPGSMSLKVYFSVHRQVARNRTEEIGVGALPVRMLFSKVTEGWMDLPTKFKVPLANYKGVIRGKILLRNIPQFAQIEGDDLRNINGTIMPSDVDLTNRKLLPWIKLPRCYETKKVGGDVKLSTALQTTLPTKTIAAGIGKGLVYMSDAAKEGQYQSSVTESASDNGSDASSSGTLPARRKPSSRISQIVNFYEGGSAPTSDAGHRPADYETNFGSSPHVMNHGNHSFGEDVQRAENVDEVGPNDEQEKERGPRSLCAGISHKYEWMRGIRADEESDDDSESDKADNIAGLRISHSETDVADGEQTYTHRHGESGYLGNGSTRWEDSSDANDMSAILRERQSRSGKSVGSAGTGDGGVEVGSAVVSMGSDDGFTLGSRTTTEDAMTFSQRFSTGSPSEETFVVDDCPDDVESGGVSDYFATTEEATTSANTLPSNRSYELPANIGHVDDSDDEWMAVHDASSLRYYFAHKVTQESLWLPPEWERMVDEEGHQYFVDHGSRTTQRGFPAAEARAYRESVYTMS